MFHCLLILELMKEAAINKEDTHIYAETLYV